MGQIKNIKLHIVTDIKNCQNGEKEENLYMVVSSLLMYLFN